MNLIESLERASPVRSRRETDRAIYLTKLSWSPTAYLHTIFRPASSTLLDAVAKEFDFPPTLIAHLQRCNGATLFVASKLCLGMSLFGCRESATRLTRDLNAGPSPLDIRPMKDKARDAVVFGSYGYDASMLMVDRRTEAVRCSFGRDVSRTRFEWSSIDDCLENEIRRLSQLFTAEGDCQVPCEGLVPTSGSVP